MKILAAVLLFSLAITSATSQECTKAMLGEVLEDVFLNAVLESLVEDVPRPAALNRIHEYNINCLAPGCMRGTYRETTITADIEYDLMTTVREIRQVDIQCRFDQNDQPAWERSSSTGSIVIRTPEQINLFLNGDANTSCASCSGPDVNADMFHCVGR